MSAETAIFLGLMSGTSLDGVDIAAVDFRHRQAHTIAAETLAYDAQTADLLQQAIQQADKIDAATLARLDNQLGLSYAQLLKQFIQQHGIDKNQIKGVGSHGHTLLHQPASASEAGYSLQIGNPNHIASETGCTVVADFRRADIALGGQGAPLAPAFHSEFLADEHEHRIVVNIGGISNITLLEGRMVISGLDTGPGNTLMDSYCQQFLQQAYDKNGELAASGQANLTLCEQILQDAYFQLDAPKSTGREYFNLHWLSRYSDQYSLSDADMLASLSYITAKSIADACLQYQENSQRLIVCGGGSHNQHLFNLLAELLPYPVESSHAHHMNPDYVEALAFAWFAKQRLENKPANIPAVTGASRACLLGAIYQV